MKKRTEEILNLLDEQYGREYICYLNYETPWQLLIATMLSAQCTDARVNIVTKDLFQKQTGVDTVTISDEGLAKAKDWREYTKDNENISHTGVNPKEELYKELNTVNNIDTASMFNCELGEVADQIQKENGLGDHSRSQEEFLTVMAKAYQVIYDRIDEEFSDPDRDPTWIRQEDGTLVEETKQDRIDALNKAYNSRAEFAAASAKVMAEIDETFHGGNYGEGFIDELQKKVMESWHNAVDEKNMQRQKVSSFQDYPVDLGIGADWSAKINKLFYR